MKLIIKKEETEDNSANLARACGYGHIIDRRTGKESYVRRPGRLHYPRFHLYIRDNKETIEFDLHLDQKQASYPGAHAHNAEYEGTAVEKEMERIRSQLRIIN